MDKILFHYPRKLVGSPKSGSEVRPIEMLKAFRSIGFTVDEVAGTLTDRTEVIRRLMTSPPDKLVQYAFLYAEADTTPPIVRDKTYSLKKVLADLSIFNKARKFGVPVSLFYRDIHWRFSIYRSSVGWYKRMVMTPLYRWELSFYSKSIDCLFLPSLEMMSSFPRYNHFESVVALPPGCRIVEPDATNVCRTSKDLHLIYVGNIVPPLYDIRPLVACVNKLPGVSLTVCCREKEWNALSGMYSPLLNNRIMIVHKNGEELADVYRQSHISMLFYPPYEYRRFAMPVKLFEALSYGVPIIASGNTAVSNFVQAENVGWTASSEEDLLRLLSCLRDNRSEVDAMSDQVRQVRFRHTWEERARKVARVLSAIRR